MDSCYTCAPVRVPSTLGRVPLLVVLVNHHDREHGEGLPRAALALHVLVHLVRHVEAHHQLALPEVQALGGDVCRSVAAGRGSTGCRCEAGLGLRVNGDQR